MYKLGIAVALIITFAYGVNRYTNYLVDIKIEDTQREVEDTINDAVKEAQDANPNSDPNISLDSLRRALRDW